MNPFRLDCIGRRLGLLAVAAGPLFCPLAWSADVPAWRLVWSDDFNGVNGSAPDSRYWTYDVGGGGWGNMELQTYTTRRQNSRIENGRLVIEARAERYTGTDGITRDYTSARLKTQNRVTPTYGRIEARIRVAGTQGLWPAFWMLGGNIATVSWPQCGEIDIMENVGKEPSRVHGGVHGPGYSGDDSYTSYCDLGGGQRYADGFHTFAVEWEPSIIRWYMDHRYYLTATPSRLPAGGTWVFDRSFFILLNVAVGGRFPGDPDATTVLPQRMEVDFVRVYARTTAPAAVVRIAAGPEGVEAFWPVAFPNGVLNHSVATGTSWVPILTDGTIRSNEFVAPVSPGIYRLYWNP